MTAAGERSKPEAYREADLCVLILGSNVAFVVLRAQGRRSIGLGLGVRELILARNARQAGSGKALNPLPEKVWVWGGLD